MRPDRRNRTILSCVAGAGMMALGAAGVHAQDAVKFGMLAPMTGTNAVQGQDMVRGLKLAIERVNNGYEVPMKGGERRKLGPGLLGKQVETLIEDTGARPAEGMDAVRQLINVERVGVVLGTYSSGVSVPTGQYANENEKIMMAVVTTSPQLREIGPYFFDAMGLDNIAAQALARFAVKDSGVTRFGSLVMNNPFGVGVEVQSCKALEEEFDGECVSTVRYEEGKSDYRAELRQVLAPKPKAAFYTAFGADSKLILRQAHEAGLKPPKGWYASYMSMWSNEVKDIAKVAEGIKGFVVGVSGDFYDNEYADAYRARHDEDPTTSFGAYTYDGAMILALAIDEAGTTDSDALRQAIPEVAARYKGITGDKTMDEHGMQVREDYEWKIYTNGQLEDYPYPE